MDRDLRAQLEALPKEAIVRAMIEMLGCLEPSLARSLAVMSKTELIDALEASVETATMENSSAAYDEERRDVYSQAMRQAEASFERMKAQARQRHERWIRELETNGWHINGDRESLGRVFEAELRSAEATYDKRIDWIVNDYNAWIEGEGTGRLVRHHAENGFQDLGNY